MDTVVKPRYDTKYIFQAMQPLLSRITLLNKLYKHFSPGGVAQLVRATES
nr:hypothetical protein [Rickettsia argasii]